MALMLPVHHVPSEPLIGPVGPFPAAAWLEIVPVDRSGFCLVRTSAAGQYAGSTWHPTEEAARAEARARYDVPEQHWEVSVSESIRSTRAAEPVGPYPHARRAGNLLFLSGVGPRERGTKVIPGAKTDASGKLLDYDFEAEMRSCFANIRAILDDAGSRWENIVDVTSFLTDMKRDWQTYNRVYGEFFPPGPTQPTRTTIEISALPTGGNTPIHFEIKVIATV